MIANILIKGILEKKTDLMHNLHNPHYPAIGA